jgi:hypothetical protein
MDRNELEKLAERYQQRADRAFENYQETGIKRYDTERNNMEDLADALRMAANAADEHVAYVGMRGSFAGLVTIAQNIELAASKESREELIDELVKSLLTYGRMYHWI